MSEELKPCPFCNGKVIINKRRLLSSEYKYYMIECTNCEIRVISQLFVFQENPCRFNLIKQWNTRATGKS